MQLNGGSVATDKIINVPAEWISVSESPLPIAEASEWAVEPHCGAVVMFLGTVRDRSEGREGVEYLEYECYQEHVEPRLHALALHAREKWPMIGKIALLHRVGRLSVAESTVAVVVSTPSRPEAFEAARFLIDTLKATIPIWKKETWRDGSEWVTCAHVDNAEHATA